MSTCLVEGCGGTGYSKEYCRMHYDRVRRRGSQSESGYKTRKCEAGGCEKQIRIRSDNCSQLLCMKHYMRIRRNGTLEVTRLHDGKAQERNRARTAAWKKANWPAYKAYLASRKARVRQATPPWADIGAIREFYKRCPPGYHVDHVVPLNGKTVSGLHVLPNLQYLPAVANLRKGNRFAVQQENNGE